MLIDRRLHGLIRRNRGTDVETSERQTLAAQEWSVEFVHGKKRGNFGGEMK